MYYTLATNPIASVMSEINQFSWMLMRRTIKMISFLKLVVNDDYFSGVCSSMGKLNAHVILSGDPMQLGPVLSSKTAETLGLGKLFVVKFKTKLS